MAEHLLFSEHMTAKDVHRPIADTYLGQAHIAGTGPEGRTCRECRFWHAWKWRKLVGGQRAHCDRPWILRQETQACAARPEEGQMQSADPEQGEPAHPAWGKVMPPFRACGSPASSAEAG
jgi:hypothetical protein